MKNTFSRSISFFLTFLLFFTSYFPFIEVLAESSILDISSFVNKTITKEKIRAYLDGSRHVDSYMSDMNWKFNIEDLTNNQDYSFDVNMDMKAGSTINLKTPGDEKLQLNVDLNGSASGQPVELNAEVRFVKDTLYFILNNVSQEFVDMNPEIEELKNQWYFYKLDGVPELREVFTAMSTGELQSQFTDEELDMLIKFIQSSEFMKNMTTSAYTSTDGVKAKCVNFSWTGKELVALIRKALTIFDPSSLDSFEEGSDEVANYFGVTKFGICTDENDFNLVYKTSFSTSFEQPDEARFEMSFEQINSKFNNDLDVAVPVGAKNINEIMPTEEFGPSEEEMGMMFESINMDEISACRDIGGEVFPDVTESFPNYDAIEYSKSNNIVNGYSDGCYYPSREITREQFIKVMVRSRFEQSEVDACTDSSFPDVATDNKFKKEICLAKKKGIVSGFSDGTFRGAQTISFGEASKMLTGSYEMELDEDTTTENKFEKYIIALEKRNAIPYSVRCVDQNMNRGEITELVYRIDANVTNKDASTFGEVQMCG